MSNNTIPDLDPVPEELKDGDVVIEVGAYEGAWIVKVCERVNCFVLAYEPATRAFKVAKENLRELENVTLRPVALGGTPGTAVLYDCMRDGANTFVQVNSEPSETVIVVDVAATVDILHEVALMHLNAEGGELDVLERLMDTGLIGNVKMIMTQWHPYDAATSKRIERVIEHLAETHYQDNIYYAWNFWRRKDNDAEADAL